nr:hypothetical protein [Treponema sp.]
MKKSNKKSKVLSIVITILVLLIFAAWYFYGKPELHISENQISLVQTEEPLINNILAKTSLNESMAQGENEGGENPAQENVTPGTEVAQESMGPQG